MIARDHVIEFTRGVMDGIRDYCIKEHGMTAEAEDGFVEFSDGWAFIAPTRPSRNEKIDKSEEMKGELYEFRLMSHPQGKKLCLRFPPNKAWQTIAWVRNKDEGREAVLLFLRGVDPPSFGEKLL